MKPFKAFIAEIKKRPSNITPGLHFVGFRGDEYHRATKVFGYPAFVHRKWDKRATTDVAPGDKVVFARQKDWDRHQRNEPDPYSHNDSEHF